MTHRGTAEESMEEPVELETDAEAAPGAAFVAALSLSALTRRPLVLHTAAPGFSRAHRALAQAAAEVVAGRVELAPDAASLTFVPGAPRTGRHELTLPDEAAAMLLVQLLLPAVALAGGKAELLVRGATHLPGAPSFHDLAFGWLPAMERLGFAAELSLESAGFLEGGGGCLRARLFPAPRVRALELTGRGVLLEVQALTCIANLGIGVARQLERRATERLRAGGVAATVEALPMPAAKSRGLAVVIAAQFERVRNTVLAVGGAGRPAEQVADEAVNLFQALLRRRGALTGPLAEQLLVPAALAASRWGAPAALRPEARAASRFTTTEVTPGLLHAAQAVRAFLDVDVRLQGLPGDEGLVEIRPRA